MFCVDARAQVQGRLAATLLILRKHGHRGRHRRYDVAFLRLRWFQSPPPPPPPKKKKNSLSPSIVAAFMHLVWERNACPVECPVFFFRNGSRLKRVHHQIDESIMVVQVSHRGNVGGGGDHKAETFLG